jgi:hypothetical protein
MQVTRLHGTIELRNASSPITSLERLQIQTISGHEVILSKIGWDAVFTWDGMARLSGDMSLLRVMVRRKLIAGVRRRRISPDGMFFVRHIAGVLQQSVLCWGGFW